MITVGDEKKKHILIHATILDKNKKSKLIDCSGLNGRIFINHEMPFESVTIPQEEGMVNAWYMIESTDSGLKLSEIFTNPPQPEPGTAFKSTSSCLIDSSLYLYGGRPLTGNYHEFNRNIIHRVDLPNYQQQGWRTCNPFDAEVEFNLPAVLGENIYIFFPNLRYTPAYQPRGQSVFCYIYNTTKQKGFFLKDSPEESIYLSICVPLEGRGILIVDIEQTKRFYLLVLVNNQNYECHICKGYEPLPDDLNWCKEFTAYAVLDGMLYILDVNDYSGLYMYAYNCWEGTLLYKVKIPKLVRRVPRFARSAYWFEYGQTHLVAVSSSEFYILWGSEIFIYCARVCVPPARETCAKVLEVCYFGIDCHGVRLNNCLAMDADLGRMAKVCKLFGKRRREESKQQLEEEKLVVPVTRPFPQMHRLSKHLVLRKLAKKMNGGKVAVLRRRKLALSKRTYEGHGRN